MEPRRTRSPAVVPPVTSFVPSVILSLVAAASLAALMGCGSTSPSPSSDDLGPGAPADSAVAGADTYASFARPFFDTYCVHCHGAGNAKRDYTQLSIIQRDHRLIACGVNPGPQALAGCPSFPPPRQFPIGAPYPSDDERARLVAWVQKGLPL